MVKFPATENIINPNDKRPMNSRTEVNVIHRNNIDNWLNTRLHRRLVDNVTGRFKQLRAIKHTEIPYEIHELMEYLRDHQCQKPDGAHIHLISEKNDHGGIPVPNKVDIVLMDLLCILSNIDKNNLQRQGDGIAEAVRHYLHNTILFRPIPERNLVTIWDKVDIHKTNTNPLEDRQFFYATCREVIASFLLWKVIARLFSPKAYYLCTPNLLWLLTLLDNNDYVRNHRDNNDYYNKHWDNAVRRRCPLYLPQRKINAIFRNGFQHFTPLFKLVHYEYDKKGDLHVFFQKCSSTSSEAGEWKWANLGVAGNIMMCISSLGWVSSSGIAPVMIKRDPPTHNGCINGQVTGGCAEVSLCGHKYTTGDRHDNCAYRLIERILGSGDFVYPGRAFLKYRSRSIAILDKFTSVTQNLQGRGGNLIMQDLEIGEEILSQAEDLLDRINSELE